MVVLGLPVLFVNVAVAQVHQGTISFSGAVVTSTCAMTKPTVTLTTVGESLSNSPAGTAGVCREGSGASQPVVVAYTSVVRTLGHTEGDILLNYFVHERRNSTSINPPIKQLLTLTYK